MIISMLLLPPVLILREFLRFPKTSLTTTENHYYRTISYYLFAFNFSTYHWKMALSLAFSFSPEIKDRKLRNTLYPGSPHSLPPHTHFVGIPFDFVLQNKHIVEIFLFNIFEAYIWSNNGRGWDNLGIMEKTFVCLCILNLSIHTGIHLPLSQCRNEDFSWIVSFLIVDLFPFTYNTFITHCWQLSLLISLKWREN